MVDGFENMRPMIPGSILGVRSFPASDGILGSISRRGNWQPGLNHAVCGVGHSHRPGNVKCSCGYWAYFDGSNDFGGYGKMTGIIRGEGLVTVGSKGFRAERAEIVALVDPYKAENEGFIPPPEVDSRNLYEKFSDYIYDHDVATYFFIILGSASIVGSAVAAFEGHWLFFILSLVSMGFLLSVVEGYENSSNRRREKRHEEFVKMLDDLVDNIQSGGVSKTEVLKVRAEYPDVPYYATLEDALADFPLSAPIVQQEGVDEDESV